MADTFPNRAPGADHDTDPVAAGPAMSAGAERDGSAEDDAPAETWAPASGEAVADIFSTDEIFRRIVATADDEFSRTGRRLFMSGVAAGLSIALTFIGRAALAGATPGDASDLIANLLYPVGFIFIVLGRYQLFTENTLTPVALVLTRMASIPRLLYIWGIVLIANLLGAATAAYFLASTSVFDPDTARAAREIARHALEFSWGTLFNKAIIAGWLVAGMVWLVHAVRNTVGRLLIVFILMYMIPSADLFHCITGSVETLYLLFKGGTSFVEYAWHFLAPVTLGNTVGGVLLVALLNYAQTEEDRFPDRDVLPWHQWLVGSRTAA